MSKKVKINTKLKRKNSKKLLAKTSVKNRRKKAESQKKRHIALTKYLMKNQWFLQLWEDY